MTSKRELEKQLSAKHTQIVHAGRAASRDLRKVARAYGVEANYVRGAMPGDLLSDGDDWTVFDDRQFLRDIGAVLAERDATEARARLGIKEEA